MLNERLDLIDKHCQDFTRLAKEKQIMEENLKQLAYMQQMQAVRQAEIDARSFRSSAAKAEAAEKAIDESLHNVDSGAGSNN